MTLYAVQVIRSQEVTIYVEADDSDAAKDDGFALSDGIDDGEWDTNLTSADADEVSNVPTGHSVWSGGEDGKWIEP